MKRRSAGRTQACSKSDAATRLAHAHKFLEMAELAASEDDVLEPGSVATALAVLAGIAAADAACCAAMGVRSRGQDHHDAEGLVRQVEPGGAQAAATLRRLLDLKDAAQYGLAHVGGQKVKAALRQATQLVEFALDVVRR